MSLNAWIKDWTVSKFLGKYRPTSFSLYPMALPTSKWKIGSEKLRTTKICNNPKLKAELSFHLGVITRKDTNHLLP